MPITSYVSPAGDPARAGAPDSVNRILDAAEHCFRTTGYEGTSVRAIAESAGVSKSLVLYHFVCKERLFVDVQLRLYQRLTEAVEAVAVERGGTPAERAMRALDTLFAAMRGGDDFVDHTLLGVRALASPTLRPHVARMRDELHAHLVRTVTRIVGEALPMSVEEAADVLSAALTGIGLQAALDVDPRHAERAMSGLRTFIAAALTQGARG